MASSDLSGFYYAPVSLAYISLTGVSTFLNLGMEQQKMFELVSAKVFGKSQFWRLVAAHFAFDHVLVAAVGFLLLYRFRFVERQYGSKKYASFLVLVLCLSSAIQLVALRLSFGRLATGPLPLLGALSVVFYQNIPKLHPNLFNFAGLEFSEKTYIYILLFIVISPGKHYAVPVLSGVLSSWLCRIKCLPLHKFRLPTFILRSFEILAPLFNTNPPSVRRRQQFDRTAGNQIQRNAQGYRDQLIPGGGPDVAAAGLQQRRRVVTTTVPSEEAITQLMTLGFDREQVSRALIASNNNVEAAANRLLNA